VPYLAAYLAAARETSVRSRSSAGANGGDDRGKVTSRELLGCRSSAMTFAAVILQSRSPVEGTQRKTVGSGFVDVWHRKMTMLPVMLAGRHGYGTESPALAAR